MNRDKVILASNRDYDVRELCVHEQNPNARKFYENNGFQTYCNLTYRTRCNYL